jgi:hypothetical protein
MAWVISMPGSHCACHRYVSPSLIVHEDCFWLMRTVGLSQDCATHVRRGLLSEGDRQARIRTFWSCYLHDKYVEADSPSHQSEQADRRLWSSYIGHESTLRLLHPAIELPAFNLEWDAIPWLGNTKRPGYLSSTFHKMSQLSTLQVEVVATM